ncbi:MAG: chemotaxis protein CheW [Proteobacteria bacterium]|nr:chemotaxis protein CheW [Pseudomonadota bacterium]
MPLMLTDTNKPLYAVVLSVGNDRYAIPVADLVEVLPLLTLKQLPQTPEWVAGLMNYRGNAVLVIDTSILMTGKPCQSIVSTRILLTSVRRKDGAGKLLGLMAEGVTGTVKILPETLRTAEIWNNGAPYLGLLAMHEGEIMQIIHADKVLTGESLKLLELENAGGDSCG